MHAFAIIAPLDKYKGAAIIMEMKLELVPIPVSDVDRAKAFYSDKIGFNVDLDVNPVNGMRVVQLTPPGSACSIVIGTGMPEIDKMQPGSVKALHLVVADVRKAREMLAERGVEVGEVQEHDQGIKYVPFSDPDGNSWLLQEMPWRTPEFGD
jgi:catechol 2,3-dioxygenase-like lactoylglutathione lyase family enzyme